MRGLARAEAAGADAIAVFTATTDAFTTANIGMTVDGVAGGVRARPGARRRARLVAARLRLDRVRLPVHRAGRARARRRGRAPPARARRRRGLLRRHDRGRRAGPGRGPDRAGGRGRHPARPDRLPLPRHPRDGPGERRGRPRRGRPLLRLVDRRDRRLPVRAGRRRQSRHRGPRLLPRRLGLGDRASSLEGVLTAARFIADALGRPLATKVGQAGGWDPTTGAPISDERNTRGSDRAGQGVARDRAQVVARRLHATRGS